MADKVKLLKLETAIDGSQNDVFPTEINPAQDYVAGKGIAFENNDNRLIDLDVSGNIQFKDFTETVYWPFWKLKRALYHVFNNAGTILASTNTEDAIKEIAVNVGTSSRSFTFCSYNGNAGAGRFLEFFPAQDSNIAPLYSPVALKIITIVSRATAAGTAQVGFYNNTTLLYTVTHTASAQVVLTGTPAAPLFTLPATGSLKVKIASGSLTKPHLYFVAQGG
jgi:hypothetical protein